MPWGTMRKKHSTKKYKAQDDRERRLQDHKYTGHRGQLLDWREQARVG